VAAVPSLERNAWPDSETEFFLSSVRPGQAFLPACAFSQFGPRTGSGLEQSVEAYFGALCPIVLAVPKVDALDDAPLTR
jgi:hypothetical protein